MASAPSLGAQADQALKVGANLVAARVVTHAARQVRARVGVGEGDEQPVRTQAEWFAHPFQELGHLVLLQPADVDGEQDHRGAVAFQVGEGEGGGGEWPVDAFGSLVQGRAEAAALYAYRRCHVAPGHAGAAAGVRRMVRMQ